MDPAGTADAAPATADAATTGSGQGRAPRGVDPLAKIARMDASTSIVLQAAEAPPLATETVREVAVELLQPSPYQPPGRPSPAAVAAVRQAITEVGGQLATLMEEAGAAAAGDGRARAAVGTSSS